MRMVTLHGASITREVLVGTPVRCLPAYNSGFKLLQFAKPGRPSVTFTMNEIAEESVSIKIKRELKFGDPASLALLRVPS